jgi:hypothetical protein
MLCDLQQCRHSCVKPAGALRALCLMFKVFGLTNTFVAEALVMQQLHALW